MRGKWKSVVQEAETDTPTLARPRRRDDLIVHELDGEGLIYDPVSADTHRLNETALFIWQCCDGGRFMRDIAESVAQTYDITAPAAVPHVEVALRRLKESRLVELASGTDGPSR